MFLQHYFWRFHTLLLAILVSVLGSGAISLVRYYGGWENLELWGYDQYVKLFPENKSDSRVVIVEFDDESKQKLQQKNISDGNLAKTIQILNKYKPRVITTNIFRHVLVGKGRSELLDYVNKQYLSEEGKFKRIIFTCQLPSSEEREGKAPPPLIMIDDGVGFADIEADIEKDIRRAPICSIPVSSLLGKTNPSENVSDPKSEKTNPSEDDSNSDSPKCNVPFSLAFISAISYLQAENISINRKDDQSLFRLGEITLPPLEKTAGSYQNLDEDLYQILIDYRLSPPVERIPLWRVLEDDFDADIIQDKIVLIGYTTEGKDHHQTPRGQLHGVEIQGIIISQIVSHILDERPLIWYWSEKMEYGWIIMAGITAGMIAWGIRSNRLMLISEGLLIGIILGTSGYLFTQQGWIPVVTPILATLVSAVAARKVISQGKPIDKLKRFRLLKDLDKDSMGKIVLARDFQKLDQLVALKIIDTPNKNTDSINKFVKEIKYIANLNSPNIVKLIDTNLEFLFDNPFYAMEFPQGKTLNSDLKQKREKKSCLSIEEAIYIIREVCQGLKELHNQGIIHRDLKPSNIWLVNKRSQNYPYQIKIFDFGIAERINPYAMRYASPEQCLGTNAVNLDKRSDIYSLGLIFYEILSGTNPYNLGDDASDKDWIDSHQDKNPIPLNHQKNCQQVPQDINDIVMRCLAKSPDDRYPDVQQLDAALSQIHKFNNSITEVQLPSNGTDKHTNDKTEEQFLSNGTNDKTDDKTDEQFLNNGTDDGTEYQPPKKTKTR